MTTISSVAGIFGSPKLVDYSCSKFAITGLMESLKLEIQQEVFYKLADIDPVIIPYKAIN